MQAGIKFFGAERRLNTVLSDAEELDMCVSRGKKKGIAISEALNQRDRFQGLLRFHSAGPILSLLFTLSPLYRKPGKSF